MGLFIALSFALAATQAAPAEDKPATAESQQKADDKIICKRNETFITGSRLSRPKKICMTAAEWRMVNDEKNQTMSRLKDGKINPNQPGTLGGTGN